jgi:hypothetical protein
VVGADRQLLDVELVVKFWMRRQLLDVEVDQQFSPTPAHRGDGRG